MTHAFQLSIFDNEGGTVLSKTISQAEDGRLLSRGGGKLSDGRVTRVEVASIGQLLDLLCSLNSSQAISFGVCATSEARVVTKAALERTASARNQVARDRMHFAWPKGPGFLILDYDPPPGSDPLQPVELISTLRRAVPELEHITIGHKPSTSSCIYDETGVELRGTRGQHLFIALERAEDAPTFGKLITDRLWLAGHGDVLVLANGQLRERTLFDASVWQPERLIYAVAACERPLIQKLIGTIYPGDIDDLLDDEARLPAGGLQHLSDDEHRQLNALKRQSREARYPEAGRRRDVWLDAQSRKVVPGDAQQGELHRVRSAMRDALEAGTLPADLLLFTEEGTQVSVRELLNDLDEWNGRRFADPLEPDYRGDNRIAVALLADFSRPYIYSHAHGGVRYYLPKLSPSLCDDRRPLQVVPAAEFCAGAPVRWIVKGYLPAASLAMLYGAPASGKSFLAFDLMWSVARGTQWRGRRTRGGKVVYIAAEGASGARLRLRAYAQHHHVALNDLPIGVIAGRPTLHREDPRALAEEIRTAGGADLIVIDTLAQATAGADENSAHDMSAAIAHCNELIELTGATVLLVHHSGKDEARGARGWSGLKGAVDVEIRVSRGESYSVAEVTKMKDGEHGDPAAFTLQQIVLGTDEDGDPVTSCVVSHIDAVEFSAAPAGKIQSIILGKLEELDFTGPFSSAELVQLTKGEHLRIYPSSPVPRSDAIKRSIRTMIKKGLIAEGAAGVTLPQPHIAPQAADVDIISIPPTPHPPTGGVVGGPMN